MTIHLTDFAKSQIRTIFTYYKEVASVEVARKIKSEIDKAILSLKDFPEQGQEDGTHTLKKNTPDSQNVFS